MNYLVLVTRLGKVHSNLKVYSFYTLSIYKLIISILSILLLIDVFIQKLFFLEAFRDPFIVSS